MCLLKYENVVQTPSSLTFALCKKAENAIENTYINRPRVVSCTSPHMRPVSDIRPFFGRTLWVSASNGRQVVLEKYVNGCFLHLKVFFAMPICSLSPLRHTFRIPKSSRLCLQSNISSNLQAWRYRLPFCNFSARRAA